MSHALAEPVCDCTCQCCQAIHGPIADRTLDAVTAVEGTDPYPFLIPEPYMPASHAQVRECGLCGRTVRGPLIPVVIGDVMRKVGRGCARKHFDVERPGLADQLLPMPPTGDDTIAEDIHRSRHETRDTRA